MAKNNSYVTIQLRSGNSVSITLDDYLDLSDIEFEELMNSEYGKYMDDVFANSQYNKKIDYSDEIDMDFDDE